MAEVDHYTTLGLSPEATQQAIEAAYRRLALERGWEDGSWHELREAYDVLSDPRRRALHDAERQKDAAATRGPQRRHLIDRLFPDLSHRWRVAIDWIATIAGAVLIVLAIKQWVVNPYRIPTSSMEPTLHCARPTHGCEADASDRVLACRICYALASPHRGDIAVFRTPPSAQRSCHAGGTFVKRIIGIGGDLIREDRGAIYVNGLPQKQSYVKYPDSRSGVWHVPRGMYFMMGDNRPDSCDSRMWGPVPRHDLIGKVVATYWPLGRLSIR